MVRNLPANAEDRGLIPGSRRSPGVGNGTPLHCLDNSMGREAWEATVHRVAKSDRSERQSTMWFKALNSLHILQTGYFRRSWVIPYKSIILIKYSMEKGCLFTCDLAYEVTKVMTSDSC